MGEKQCKFFATNKSLCFTCTNKTKLLGFSILFPFAKERIYNARRTSLWCCSWSLLVSPSSLHPVSSQHWNWLLFQSSAVDHRHHQTPLPPHLSSYRMPPSLSSTSDTHSKSLSLTQEKMASKLPSCHSPTRRTSLVAEWDVSFCWTSNQPLRLRFINISANHSAVEAWLRLWLVLISPHWFRYTCGRENSEPLYHASVQK